MSRINTLNAFRECFHGSEGAKSLLKELILNNLKEKKKKSMRLDLVWLTYDFNNQKVLIEYYVEDRDYPAVNISFEDFKKLISTI